MNKGITITESDYDDRTLLISGKIDFNFNVKVTKRYIDNNKIDIMKEVRKEIYGNINRQMVKKANEISADNNISCNKCSKLIDDIFKSLMKPLKPTVRNPLPTEDICSVCGCLMRGRVERWSRTKHDEGCIVEKILNIIGEYNNE